MVLVVVLVGGRAKTVMGFLKKYFSAGILFVLSDSSKSDRVTC